MATNVTASELFEIGRKHIEQAKSDLAKKIMDEAVEKVKEATDGKVVPSVQETPYGAVLSISINPTTKEGQALIANERKTGVISSVFERLQDNANLAKLMSKGE